MRTIGPYKKTIAPRLASGKSRENWGGRLPESIKYGIYRIAQREKKSVSWVLEEVVIAYFGLTQPEYVQRKPKPGEAVAKADQTQTLAEANARQKHRRASASTGASASH